MIDCEFIFFKEKRILNLKSEQTLGYIHKSNFNNNLFFQKPNPIAKINPLSSISFITHTKNTQNFNIWPIRSSVLLLQSKLTFYSVIFHTQLIANYCWFSSLMSLNHGIQCKQNLNRKCVQCNKFISFYILYVIIIVYLVYKLYFFTKYMLEFALFCCCCCWMTYKCNVKN